MDRISFETALSPKIYVKEVKGNLRIKGWDRTEIKADSTKADTLEIQHDDKTVSVTCASDLILRVPIDSILNIGTIHGDLMLKSLENQIEIDTTHGQILAKSVGSTSIKKVKGNLNTKYVEGDFTCEKGEADINIHDVEGSINIHQTSGNLTIRGFSSSISAHTKANASLRLDPKLGEKIYITADGNIHCRLEPDVSAKIHLVSKAEKIKIDAFGINEQLESKEYEFIAGDGAGEIRLESNSGIDLISTMDNKSDRGFSFEVDGDLSNLAEDITQVVNEQIEQKMNVLTKHLDELTSQLPNETISDKTKRKLESKRRSFEKKFDINDKKRTHTVRVYKNREDTSKLNESVTNQERQKVLEMLQNQQISVAEAEILLAALEGKQSDTSKK